MGWFALLSLGAYVSGSVLMARWVARWFKLQEPLMGGSKNPGATNMMRLGGFWPAALTLILDALKAWCWFPVARALGLQEAHLLSLIGLAAVLGHCYPMGRFYQGGKGVATAWGALIGLSPPAAGLVVVAWGIGFSIARISAVGALCGLIAALASLYLIPEAWPGVLCMVAVVFVRHRTNWKALVAALSA